MTTNIFHQLYEVLPHGSGIDLEWNFTITRSGKIHAHNSFHAMDKYGGYDGWFDFTAILAIAKDGSIELVRIEFNNCYPEHYTSGYQLREYLEDTIAASLE